MSDEISNIFIKRTIFLISILIFLVIILLGRMCYLQIFEGAHYRLLAEGNRIVTRPLIPLRGQIYDRHGVPLATNETNFRVVFLTDKRSEIEETLHTLSGIIVLSEDEKAEVSDIVRKKRGLDTVVIKDNLSWPEISAIELYLADLPGIAIEVGATRQYPQGLASAHLVGYVGSASEKEQAENATYHLPGLKIGKVGIEKYLEASLQGSPGHSAFEINAKRKVVRELHQVPSITGQDVHLTIDSRLQNYVQDVLSHYESASAVVIDIHNGDILALVSSPSFNPNLFPQGIGHKPWHDLQENPYVPLTNKAISGRYAPGSTVKLFVALAALELGIIDKNTTVYCPGHTSVGTHKFHCMHSHGNINVSRAIVESCDVFFYEISKKIGIDKLAAFYEDFGFGSGGLEEFPHIKKGIVPTKAWKTEKKNASWTVSDTIQTSIGQGYMLATPLELAVSMARLAGGGRKVAPRLVKGEDIPFPKMDLNKMHLETVLEATGGVVNLPNGTAFRSASMHVGCKKGGKTGTSQVSRITMQQRKAGLTKTHHLAWKYREHGIFIAYAPLDSPRYAVAVVVEHAAGSGPAARSGLSILQYAHEILGEEKTHDN